MNIKQLLTKYWGHTSFRPMQEEIIQAVLEGKDTLALLPTGGGKSVCFQIPTLAREGICIVVSPLIALMKDQVEQLRKKGIPSLYIISGMSYREIDIALDNCIYGPTKFLYLSPERLSSEIFKVRLEKMNVSLFAIDEAHCISQWGYDFRPSYLKIAELRKVKPGVPVLALTATATPDVMKDIQEKLLFKKEHILRVSFERKNLSYVVFHEENKLQRAVEILEKVPGSAIVYVRSRKQTKETASFLSNNRIAADYYHAGLSTAERSMKQDAWMKEQVRVIVATNAFGMGIDKPNVRTVIHCDLPDSLEAYFQEAGRAGRDQKRAFAVMLYNETDEYNFMERIKNMFPSAAEVRRVYQALANYFQIPIGSGEGNSYDFDISAFSSTYDLNPAMVFNMLHTLELEGYIATTDSFFSPSRFRFTVNNDTLYDFQLRNIAYDPLIKTLLRSYAGIFDDYVKIDERELARRAKMAYGEIIKTLTFFGQSGIGDYLKQKDSPQIIFTYARVDAETMHLSREHMVERKNRYLRKMEAVLEYASRTTKCRTQMLLAYFGESYPYRCGNCDVCLERNKLDLSDLEFSNVKEQIKEFVKGRAMFTWEILEKIGGSTPEKVIKVIRWLLDNEKIKINAENKITWKE